MHHSSIRRSRSTGAPNANFTALYWLSVQLFQACYFHSLDRKDPESSGQLLSFKKKTPFFSPYIPNFLHHFISFNKKTFLTTQTSSTSASLAQSLRILIQVHGPCSHLGWETRLVYTPSQNSPLSSRPGSEFRKLLAGRLHATHELHPPSHQNETKPNPVLILCSRSPAR